MKRKSSMVKVILITNDQNAVAEVKNMALKNQYNFTNYTEDDWATFEDIEQYIQDEEISKKIIDLPMGHRPVFSLEEMEAETIKKVINNVNGNAVKAAKALKIGRATLYRKLDKYGFSLKQIRRHRLDEGKVESIRKQLHVVKKAS